ncbi:ABC transporter permease, partial [Methylobacterium radiotolerans]
GGGGLGAVLVITSITSSTGGMIVGAVTGSLLAFALVYLLSWRGGLNADRFLLIGIGVSYFTVSLTTFFLLRSNPWDTPKI